MKDIGKILPFNGAAAEPIEKVMDIDPQDPASMATMDPEVARIFVLVTRKWPEMIGTLAITNPDEYRPPAELRLEYTWPDMLDDCPCLALRAGESLLALAPLSRMATALLSRQVIVGLPGLGATNVGLLAWGSRQKWVVRLAEIARSQRTCYRLFNPEKQEMGGIVAMDSRSSIRDRLEDILEQFPHVRKIIDDDPDPEGYTVHMTFVIPTGADPKRPPRWVGVKELRVSRDEVGVIGPLEEIL